MRLKRDYLSIVLAIIGDNLGNRLSSQFLILNPLSFMEVIDPKHISHKNISEIKESVNGNPYFWLELSESKYGSTASRTVWGKYRKDGSISWKRASLEKFTHVSITTLMEYIDVIVIDPTDYEHLDLGEDYYLPSIVIKFRDEALEYAVRSSKRRHYKSYRRQPVSTYYDLDYTGFEEYGGPSDGYGGRLDDDFINDVLDGDPDAYWNID